MTTTLIVFLIIVIILLSIVLYSSIKKNTNTKDLEYIKDSLVSYNKELQAELANYKLKLNNEHKKDNIDYIVKADDEMIRKCNLIVAKLKSELHYKDLELNTHKLLLQAFTDKQPVDDLIKSIRLAVGKTVAIRIEENKNNNK